MRYTLLPLLLLLILLSDAATIFPPLDATAASSRTHIFPAPTPEPIIPRLKKAAVPDFVDAEFDGKEVVKTDAEWKKLLPADAFDVMRREGTEAAYSGSLVNNHKHGVYYCAACHLALFRSGAKFESHTGWPSFYEPAFKKNVIEKEDKSFGMVRMEVQCARCRSHLGHVFDDGPKPTGLRYCMNSVALRFEQSK